MISLVLAREGVVSPLERLGFQAACERMMVIGPGRSVDIFLKLLSRAGSTVSLQDLFGPRPDLSADPAANVRRGVERARYALDDLGFEGLITDHPGEGYSISPEGAQRWIRHVVHCAELLA